MPGPFTFEREARWMTAVTLGLALAGIVIVFLVPWLARHRWW